MTLRSIFFELMKYARSLPTSKHSLLRVIAKIFDPLGLLAPFVIRLKALFQLVEMTHYKESCMITGQEFSQNMVQFQES